MSKIEDTDLNVDRLENLAKLVVDRWDMDCLLDFAQLDMCFRTISTTLIVPLRMQKIILLRN